MSSPALCARHDSNVRPLPPQGSPVVGPCWNGMEEPGSTCGLAELREQERAHRQNRFLARTDIFRTFCCQLSERIPHCRAASRWRPSYTETKMKARTTARPAGQPSWTWDGRIIFTYVTGTSDEQRNIAFINADVRACRSRRTMTRWAVQPSHPRLRPCHDRAAPFSACRGGVPSSRQHRLAICRWLEPSDGVEPSTPSLPFRFWDGKRGHTRAFAATKIRKPTGSDSET